MTLQRNAYQIQRDAAVRTVRAHVNVQADWLEVVTRFSDWLTWLTANDSARYCSSRILDALSSSSDSFSAWSSQKGLDVTDSEEALLELVEDGPRKSLRADVAYLLGWAAARSYIQRPEGSRGFTAAYELVRLLDSFGVGYAGVADALAACSEEEWHRLKQEVEAIIGKTPQGVLEDIPSPFPPLDNAKRLWESALEAEQTINQHILDVPFPTVLPRILADMGRRDINFLAKALDSTAGPWVTWSCLAELQTDQLVELLKRADECYQADGTWTRKWAARLIVHRLETNLRLEWDDADRERPTDAEPHPHTRAVTDTVSAICRALEGRVGGQILLTRWAAHLLMEATNAESAIYRNRHHEGLVRFYYAALNALIDSVGGQAWTAVNKVRDGFPVTSISKNTAAVDAPAWIDQMGRIDYAVPLACTVALQQYDGAEHAYIPELNSWLANVVTSLRDTPSAHYLASENANLLTRLVAWPLFAAPNRTEHLKDIWQQLAITRVEASYRRDYDSSSATETCSSVANIALEALSWGTTLPSNECDVDSYAELVANVIDELRYFVPNVGLKTWSTTTSRLMSVLAATGRFDAQDALHAILRRYVGDIDTLALASASAIANGVAADKISAALISVGVSPQDMTSDYCSWQIRAQNNLGHNKVTEILQAAYGDGV